MIINSKSAYDIMNKMLTFKDTVISACQKQEPHIICNYVYELTSMFHSYYGQEKFITDDEQYTKERMALSTLDMDEEVLNLFGDSLKQVKTISEDAKVSIRNIRHEGIESIEKLELPEDEEKGLEKDIQDLVNEYNKKIEALLKDKEQELLTV